ncbi:unnamed protein product [Clonostachys byssicola]|uniref:Uncharacterized protein n=1 Tax=Clonostachys byssicola TaxID=160290 RepID=A0A9N9V1K4_9HYPO|nr:unnamed protein product [Clonostachys byssicola]
MDDEEAIWGTLSTEEHRSVWEETEANFWAKFALEQKEWRSEQELDFNEASVELRAELTSLTGQRKQLTETQERLNAQLAKVAGDLRNVVEQCDARTHELSELDQAYRKRLEEQSEKWEVQRSTMQRFFKEKHGGSVHSDDEEDEEDEEEAEDEPMVDLPVTVQQTIIPRNPKIKEFRESGKRSPKPIPMVEHREKRRKHTEPLVNVIDITGRVIGPVELIEPWNKWVKEILKLPIRRPVTIRPGRRFTDEHLSTIYERSESKGVKWLSCMIQAIGQIQSKRCASCEKNQGVFQQCIIVGGELLQKCGNCEWNRQGCHGASGEGIDFKEAAERMEEIQKARAEQKLPASPEYPRDEADNNRRLATHLKAMFPEREKLEREKLESNGTSERRLEPKPPFEGPPVEVESLANPAWQTIRMKTSDALLINGSTPSRILPGGSSPTLIRTPLAPAPRVPLPSSGFTPANPHSRPSSRPPSRPPSNDTSTPKGGSLEPSPQASPHLPSLLPAGPRPIYPPEPLEEINKDNLVLRHNGEVYTHPDCMVGVPVAKIDWNHPYWDRTWKDIRAEVQDSRERWVQKQKAIHLAEARKEACGSSKYQAGRQINRGTKILEFLDEGEISPYQLLAKKHMHASKGGIASYDTLFRLCDTVSELQKYNLDITPLEWIRHRLHELIQAEGKSFNLPRTMHDFYHDPKLSALRTKHGYKNIGRPSAAKTGRSSLGATTPSGTPQPLKKRKSMLLDSEITPASSRVASPTPSSHGGGPRIHDLLNSPNGPAVKRPRTQEDSVGFNEKRPSPVIDMTPSKALLGDETFFISRVRESGYESPPHFHLFWKFHPIQRSLQLCGLPNDNNIVQLHQLTAGVSLNDIMSVRWSPESLCIVIMRKVELFNPPTFAKTLCSFHEKGALDRFLDFCKAQRLNLIAYSRAEVEADWPKA